MSRHLLGSIWWGALAIMTLWVGDHFPNRMVQVAIVSLFLGKAALSVCQLVGTLRGESPVVAFGRGFRIVAIGYVVIGCAIGVAALQSGGFGGYLVAYGAFSFAWFWYDATTRFLKPKT